MDHFWFYFSLYSIVFKYNFIKLILPPVFSGGFFIVNLIYKSGKNVVEYKGYSTYTKITQGYVSYWDGTLYKKS